MERSCKVCVTGGNGYIGSWLVMKLLDKGYTVHATLRDLKNESKVGLLRGLPNAETRLVLFEADVYNPDEFEAALQGCEFVFHVATPFMHQNGSQYKDVIEATIAGSKGIAMLCKRTGTVRRLIYTSSVLAASPLKEDGSGFKDSMDETCWTPLVGSISHKYPHDFHREYTYSKTLTDQAMLSLNDNEIYGGLEVVSLACGLVAGATILSYIPASLAAFVSQLTEHSGAFQSLKFLEEMLGKVPLVHIDDVCEAHIFCMENPSINGRFLCANSYVSLEEIAGYFLLHHPQFPLKQEHVRGLKNDIKWGSTKLTDNGFVYKHDTKIILDESIKCARRMGYL